MADNNNTDTDSTDVVTDRQDDSDQPQQQQTQGSVPMNGESSTGIENNSSDTSDDDDDYDYDDDGGDAYEYRQLTNQRNRLIHRSLLFGIKKSRSCSRLTNNNSTTIRPIIVNNINSNNRSMEYLSNCNQQQQQQPQQQWPISVSERSIQQQQQERPLLLAPVARISSNLSVQSVALSQTSNESSLLDYPVNTPICKFCHQRAKPPHNPLISPCHCKGTIRYMHTQCLMKWIDKLKRRNSRSQPLSCEICNYQYRWRKQFKPLTEWAIPPCMSNDRNWHLVFVICALLSVLSMVSLVIFGDDDHDICQHPHHHSHHGGHGAHNRAWHHSATVTTDTHHSHLNGYVLKQPIIIGTNNTLEKNRTFDQIFSSNNSGDPPLVALIRNISFSSTKLFDKPPTTVPLSKINNITSQRQKQHLVHGGSAPASSSTSGFNSFHPSTEPWRRRRTQTTEPHEVVMIFSGCLFFISFFLGTYAQIKTEVGFFSMFMRFIRWNQQWIIEEYDDSHSGTVEETQLPPVSQQQQQPTPSAPNPPVTSSPRPPGTAVVVVNFPPSSSTTTCTLPSPSSSISMPSIVISG